MAHGRGSDHHCHHHTTSPPSISVLFQHHFQMEPKPDPLDPAVVTAVVREPTPDPMDPAAIAVSARPEPPDPLDPAVVAAVAPELSPHSTNIASGESHRFRLVIFLTPLAKSRGNTTVERLQEWRHVWGQWRGYGVAGTVAGRWRDGGGTVAGQWRDSGGTVQQGTSTFYRALVSQRMGRHEAQGS